MKQEELLARLNDCGRQESDGAMRELVSERMAANRAETVQSFIALLGEMTAPTRKRLLEVLSDDGGSDILPLYIMTIENEPNLLAARSALFLYGNFETREALEQLLSLEEKIRPQLEPVWKKTTNGLKGRFKEYYAIWLFKNGAASGARMAEAARLMIGEPHPDYLPFLNHILPEPNHSYRLHAARILAFLGDRTSMAPLFTMLPRTFDETVKTRKLYDFLTSSVNLGAGSLGEYMQFLGNAVELDEDTVKRLTAEVSKDKVWNTLQAAQTGFGVSAGAFWDEAGPYLRQVLLNKRSDKMRDRLDEALEKQKHEEWELAEQLCKTMGEIGHREKVPNLLARFQAQLPEDQEKADKLLVTFLTSYRGEDAVRVFLEFLNPKKPQGLILSVLEALKEYTFDDVPREVLDLIVNPCDIDVRKKAQELLASCGNLEAVLDELLEHKSPAIRGDAVDLIIEHNLEAGYPLMLEQLNKKLPQELLEKVIMALGVFPKPDHCEPLITYLRITWALPVRTAAMRAILTGTAPQRFERVMEAIAAYQPRTRLEMVELLVTLLSRDDIKIPADFFSYSDFFRSAMEERHEPVRVGSIYVLERMPWGDCDNREPWAKAVKLASTKHDDLRSPEEKERMMALRERILNEQSTASETEDSAEQPEKPKQALKNMVDKLAETDDPAKGLRQFNLFFKPEMLEAEPLQRDRIIDLVEQFAEAAAAAKGGIILLKGLLGKIGDPELVQRTAPILAAAQAAAKEHMAAARAKAAQKSAPSAPAAPESKQPAAADNPAAQASDGERPPIKSVLLIDDSALFNKALGRILSEHGFQVATESDPTKGLKTLVKTRFDLLILDYVMPGLNGIELLEEARRLKAAPPYTIFITSSRDRNVLTQMVASGVDGLLLKPFAADALLQKINEINPVPQTHG